MERITSTDGTTVSFDKSGSGPALVHGGFGDHNTKTKPSMYAEAVMKFLLA